MCRERCYQPKHRPAPSSTPSHSNPPDQRTKKHILILILIFIIIFLHCNVKPRHLSTIPHRTESPEELFPDELYMTYPPFSTYEIP